MLIFFFMYLFQGLRLGFWFGLVLGKRYAFGLDLDQN